jgi:hypothetical protein
MNSGFNNVISSDTLSILLSSQFNLSQQIIASIMNNLSNNIIQSNGINYYPISSVFNIIQELGIFTMDQLNQIQNFLNTNSVGLSGNNMQCYNCSGSQPTFQMSSVQSTLDWWKTLSM